MPLDSQLLNERDLNSAPGLEQYCEYSDRLTLLVPKNTKYYGNAPQAPLTHRTLAFLDYGRIRRARWLSSSTYALRLVGIYVEANTT